MEGTLKIEKDTVTVILDGKELMKHQMEKPRSAGGIGLQENAGLVSFRNIKMRKLG